MKIRKFHNNQKVCKITEKTRIRIIKNMELLDIYIRLQTLEVLVHTLLFVYLETISVLHMSDLQFHLNLTSMKIGKWTR